MAAEMAAKAMASLTVLSLANRTTIREIAPTGSDPKKLETNPARKVIIVALSKRECSVKYVFH